MKKFIAILIPFMTLSSCASAHIPHTDYKGHHTVVVVDSKARRPKKVVVAKPVVKPAVVVKPCVNVRPAMGVQIVQLPKHHTRLKRNGETLYVSDNVLYKKVRTTHGVRYQVVGFM